MNLSNQSLSAEVEQRIKEKIEKAIPDKVERRGALELLAERITGDYWTNSVVGALETQRGKAPVALAFRAAQVILGARALFSDQTLRNLLAPPGKGRRADGEVQHLFPKAWLIARGIKDRRRINQVANLATKIEQFIPERERETLLRALRARPSGADPLSVVDYLYLAQLPPLLFVNEVWQDARVRFGGAQDVKQKLQAAIQQIAPVRNEIAHVREVSPERLQKAHVACSDVLAMLPSRS